MAEGILKNGKSEKSQPSVLTIASIFAYVLGTVLAMTVLLAFAFLHSLAHDVPLFSAAQDRNWQLAADMLNRGADPNDTSELQNGRTALYTAIPEDRVDIVKLMIKKGADVNKLDDHGETPLDYAYLGTIEHTPERSEILKILERAGAKHGNEINR